MRKTVLLLLGLLLTVGGCATPLKVVDVSAPGINCVFHPSCRVTVNDSSAAIPIPAGGTNFLQSRTFTGAAGAPANGLHAYEYRVDLRNALGITFIPCVSAVTLDIGPVVSTLDYDGDTFAGDQVFVVTGGGLGTIGVASAKQAGRNVTFEFSAPVCAGGSPGSGQSSFFFGIVSTEPPRPITAKVKEVGGPDHDVPARAPQVP